MPILWASSMDVGADVMKRIAAPMVGGLVTSFVLELTIYPAIFALWKRIGMEGWGALFRPPARPDAADHTVPTLSPLWKGAGIVSVLVLSGTLGLAWMTGTGSSPGGGIAAGEVVHSEQLGGMEVTLRHPSGVFRSGANRFGIEIVDVTTGEPVTASRVGMNLFMPAMGAMQAMSATADVEAAEAGQWSGTINLPVAGEWQVTLDIEGPEGGSEVRFPTVAR